MVQTMEVKATETATTVNTKEFARELEWIARFIETRATIPILSNVAIVAAGGNIRLVGTDLEVGAITDLESSDDSFFSITVPAKQALKYLKKVQESEVSLSVADNKLTIRHGDDSEVEIPGMSMDSYPELPVCNTADEIVLSGLAVAIPRTLTAICDIVSRFTLDGALLEVKDGTARLVSTDGHRLSLHEISASAWPSAIRALLPRKVLSEFAHLKADTARFSQTEHFAQFRIENHANSSFSFRQIIARKLTGNFPDYERVIPKQAHVCTVAAEPLRKVIDRVALFADERSGSTLYTLTDGKLTVSSSTSDSGKAKGSVPATWEGPEYETGLDWRYVQEFLKLIPPAVAFDYSFNDHTVGHNLDGSTNGKVNPHAVTFEIPGWSYVVMPLRV